MKKRFKLMFKRVMLILALLSVMCPHVTNTNTANAAQGDVWYVPATRMMFYYACVRDNTPPLLISDSGQILYRNGILRYGEDNVLNIPQTSGSVIRTTTADFPSKRENQSVFMSDNFYQYNSWFVNGKNTKFNYYTTFYSDAYKHYFFSSDPNKPNEFVSFWGGTGHAVRMSGNEWEFGVHPVRELGTTKRSGGTVQDVVVKVDENSTNFNIENSNVRVAGYFEFWEGSYLFEPDDYMTTIPFSPGWLNSATASMGYASGDIRNSYYKAKDYSLWKKLIYSGVNSLPTIPYSTSNLDADILKWEKQNSPNNQIIKTKGDYFPYEFNDGPISFESATVGQLEQWDKENTDPMKYHDRDWYFESIPAKLGSVSNCQYGDLYRAYFTMWTYAYEDGRIDVQAPYDGPSKDDVQDDTQLNVGDIKDEITDNNSSITDGLTNSDIENAGKSTDKLYEEDTTSSLTASFTNVPSSGMVTVSDTSFRPELTISLKDYLYKLPFTINSNNGDNSNENTMWTNYKDKSKLTSDIFIYKVTDPLNIPSTFVQYQSKPDSDFVMPITTVSSAADKPKLDNFKITEPGYYVLGANVKSALTGETNFQTKTVKVMFANGFNGLPVKNYLDTVVNDSMISSSFLSKNHNMNFKYPSTNSLKVESAYNSSNGTTAIGSTTNGIKVLNNKFDLLDSGMTALNGKPIASIIDYKDGFLVLEKNGGLYYVNTKTKTTQSISGLTNNNGNAMMLEGTNLYVATTEGLHVGSLTDSNGTLTFREKKSITNNEVFGSNTQIGTVNTMLGKIAVTPISSSGSKVLTLISKN